MAVRIRSVPPGAATCHRLSPELLYERDLLRRPPASGFEGRRASRPRPSVNGCWSSVASATSSEKGVRNICNALEAPNFADSGPVAVPHFLDVDRVKETPPQSLDQRTRAEGFKR